MAMITEETKSSKITLDDDGIIRVLAVSETHTEDDAREVTAAVNRMAKEKKYPVLIDSTGLKEMTPESKAFYQSREQLMAVTAVAIIIKSGISRIIVNFLMEISKLPGPPRKLFNDETKAVQWLKNQSPDVPAEMETNILIYEPISQVQKPMIHIFIKNGIKCRCIKERKEIFSMLHSKKFNVFICTSTPGTEDITDTIKEIKKDPELNFIKIILWTAPAPKSFYEDMIKLGISGIILKPFVEETFESNVFKLLFRNDKNPERRQIIRVEPDSGERNIVAIRSAITHKTIISKINSISMNGMVIEMTGEFTADDLKEKDEIFNNNIKITLNDNDFSTNGIVQTRKQNLVVIKFIEMQDYYKNVLSSYIYKRLNLL